jgi:hypothetical protein
MEKMPNRNFELLILEQLAYLPVTHPSNTDRTRDDLSEIVTCLEET